MTYKCIKGFNLEMYDADGFLVENKYVNIEIGSIWEKDGSDFRVAGDQNTVRLESKDIWIEIAKERFEECFEEAADGNI